MMEQEKTKESFKDWYIEYIKFMSEDWLKEQMKRNKMKADLCWQEIQRRRGDG